MDELTCKIPEENQISQFEFTSGAPLNTWFLRINKNGIFFNKEIYPDSMPDDFARAFIEVLEKNYDVTFTKRTKDS